jgi:hypothetical protein
VLRRKKLWVLERSATRQVQRGDVLACWVMVALDGETTLEGAICHVSHMHAAPLIEIVRELHADLGRQRDMKRLDWRKRSALIAPLVVAVHDAVLTNALPPQLVNRSGDALLFSTAHYQLNDHAAAASALERWLGEPDSEGGYALLDDGTVHAHVALEPKALRVECNSKQRLTEARRELERRLGGAVTHRADEHVDPVAELERRRKDPHASNSHRKQPEPVPPEAVPLVQAAILEQMRKWVDEPIPMLNGKSPRQAVRSARGREDVTHMLVRQQEMFGANGNLPPIDLAPIWKELGLRPR